MTTTSARSNVRSANTLKARQSNFGSDLFRSDLPRRVVQRPPMPSSEFRNKAVECGRMARDATRTEAQRAESHLQETLWLKIADADENDDARRLRMALRGAD